MRLITDRTEARDCFEALDRALGSLATEKAGHRAVFRPSSHTAPTYFFGSHGIWAMLTDGIGVAETTNRYYNPFGIGGNPEVATVRTSVEINHPHEGRRLSISGRFLIDSEGYWIGHTGKIGGGIRGSDAGALERLSGRKSIALSIDGHEQKLAFLARVEPSADFVARIADFVHLMDGARKLLQAINARG